METINLHIKNMVCSRCIWAVEQTFKAIGVDILHIEMGHSIVKIPDEVSMDTIEIKLQELGFELLENKEDIIINQLKKAIDNYLKLMENFLQGTSLSEFLSKEVGKNYNYISKLFSRHESLTIESYYIHKRIDRVKELLDYDQLSLSEIAAKLNYSSVHYLSSQFKKVTGLSVSEFKHRLKQKEQVHTGLKNVYDDLNDRGFVFNFNGGEDCLECPELCTSFNLEDVEIKEEYRFKAKKGEGTKLVVYSVQTKDGLKGILMDGLNGYSSKLSQRLLSNATVSR